MEIPRSVLATVATVGLLLTGAGGGNLGYRIGKHREAKPHAALAAALICERALRLEPHVVPYSEIPEQCLHSKDFLEQGHKDAAGHFAANAFPEPDAEGTYYRLPAKGGVEAQAREDVDAAEIDTKGYAMIGFMGGVGIPGMFGLWLSARREDRRPRGIKNYRSKSSGKAL